MGVTPVIDFTAALVMSSWRVVCGLGGVGFCSCRPLYRVAWVMVEIWAPLGRYRWMAVGRGGASSSGRSAPSAARRSAWLFPSESRCPFTHWKRVGAVRARQREIMARKRSPLSTPIHPFASHLGAFLMIPVRQYMESEMIVRGATVGADATAWRIATSSAVWFVGERDTSRTAALRGWSGPAQTPAPACES